MKKLAGILPSAFFVLHFSFFIQASAQVRVLDLDEQLVDPFGIAPGTKAIVFLFTTIDCPISNRYAPEVRRLHEKFAPKGVTFRLVYANPAENADAIRKHLEEYYEGSGVFSLRSPDRGPLPEKTPDPFSALRDPRHELVGLTKATVTPEAVVFTPSPGGFGGAGTPSPGGFGGASARNPRLVYRGRIDDRYVDLGVDRQVATTHDLEDALAAILAGKPVPQPITQAVGCILADFVR